MKVKIADLRRFPAVSGNCRASICRQLVQLFFPLRCPVCDDIVIPYGQKVCPQCRSRLRPHVSPRCMKCGKTLEDAQKEYCRDCEEKTHFFERGRMLYEYESVAASIYRFKYGNRREYAGFFGGEIWRYLEGFIQAARPDGLIPVPLHPKRERLRGYNQAALLAKEISRLSGIPVYDKIVVRKKNTVPLKKLNAPERQNNLKKAFIIRGNDVKLDTVILIDDIFTTGSTIDEVSKVLIRAGVKKVYFITLAGGAQ